jgi:hypothetical protein
MLFVETGSAERIDPDRIASALGRNDPGALV